MINTTHEKFSASAGIIPIIGITKLAIYKLLEQNGPFARLEKFFTFPSLLIFLKKGELLVDNRV